MGLAQVSCCKSEVIRFAMLLRSLDNDCLLPWRRALVANCCHGALKLSLIGRKYSPEVMWVSLSGILL